jgi:hypothetical protein
MRQDDNLLSEINSLASDERAEVIDFILRLKTNRKVQVAQNQNDTSDSSLEAPIETPLRQFGGMKGLVVYMAPDFNAPLEEFAEYI